MKQKYRLYEVENVVADMGTSDVADDIAETEEDTQLVISGWYVHIPNLNLNLHEGVVCIWDDEGGLFMPEFAVTVIHEGNFESKVFRTEEESVCNESDECTDAFLSADYLYYEQEGFVDTLVNWLNGRLSMEQIEQLRCELIVPGTNHLKKESED
ncbi:MAG: hypothetical protein PHX08_10005 [Lachnospiraceae bacterium]|nr:hypothetical protein [Lachnospiraceae bacterium]